jgi:hypothetical protein
MSMKKRKGEKSDDQALHEATHGQFGEEPRPEPMPYTEDKDRNNYTAKSVYAAIIDYAEKENVDLIVIGTKGKTGLKRMLLGSVATGVGTYATCPVLVVR